MTDSSFFNLGVKLAASVRNRDPQSLVSLSGLTSTLDNPKEANYGFVQKFVCKVAADAFAEAGRKHEIEYHVFEKLALAPVWHSQFDNYSDAALIALGKIAMEYEEQEKEATTEAVTKEASTFLPNLIAMTGKSTPDIVKGLAAMGALGGSVTGGLYWLLNRHSQEDEDDAEVIKAKIDYYNKVSDEIKRQLGTKKVAPAELASQVQEIVNRDNLF
ncbi:MAG: hypothetical protein ACK5DE_01935 [Bacteroidota bacterium]|jgi:hypothetical protein